MKGKNQSSVGRVSIINTARGVNPPYFILQAIVKTQNYQDHCVLVLFSTEFFIIPLFS